MYDRATQWPDRFDPDAAGAGRVDQEEPVARPTEVQAESVGQVPLKEREIRLERDPDPPPEKKHQISVSAEALLGAADQLAGEGAWDSHEDEIDIDKTRSQLRDELFPYAKRDPDWIIIERLAARLSNYIVDEDTHLDDPDLSDEDNTAIKAAAAQIRTKAVEPIIDLQSDSDVTNATLDTVDWTLDTSTNPDHTPDEAAKQFVWGAPADPPTVYDAKRAEVAHHAGIGGAVGSGLGAFIGALATGTVDGILKGAAIGGIATGALVAVIGIILALSAARRPK